MTHKEMIRKYNLKLVDGEKIKATGNLTPATIKMLNAAKIELIAMLQKREAAAKALAAERAAEKKAEIAAQRETRRWALVNSGSYLMDCYVEYVVPLTADEKTKYREDFAKNNLYKLAIDDYQTNLDKIKYESNLIKIIQDRKNDGYLSYGESVVWLITEEEKNILLSDLKQHTEKIEKEKAEKRSKKAEELRKFQEQAQKTGKPIVMYSYVTQECMNGGHDCSFDTATVFMNPDGTEKTTYTCCH